MRVRRQVLAVLASLALAAPPPAAAASPEPFGLVIFIDGAKGDAWERMMDAGRLPTAKRLFRDEGVWVEHATSVFPTITGAGMPAVMTGAFPGKHGITSLYFYERSTNRHPVLYSPDEAAHFDDWLRPGTQVKTIFEHMEDAETLSIGTPVHRSADTDLSWIYNAGYPTMKIRASLTLKARKIFRKITGEPPARLTVAYHGWFDHREHLVGSESDAILADYAKVDALIADTVRIFHEIIDDHDPAAPRYIALVSDHGHQDIHEGKTWSIDKHVKEVLGARVLEKKWRRVAGNVFWGRMPSDEDVAKCEVLAAAGEGHALVYFPRPTRIGRDASGGLVVEERDWKKAPTFEQLRSYPFQGKARDMIALALTPPAREHLSREPADFVEGETQVVSFVVTKDFEAGEVHVFSRRADGGLNQATIFRDGDDATRARYAYVVAPGGEDPLGYSAPGCPARELVGGDFHPAAAWQRATLDTEAPDGPVQLFQAFDDEDRAPDMFLSAAPYWSIGDLATGEQSHSKHGGLTKDESWATLAFHGTGLSPARVETARITDMVPTMLHLLGRSWDPRLVDGEVLPEVLRQTMGAGAPVLARPAGTRDAVDGVDLGYFGGERGE